MGPSLLPETRPTAITKRRHHILLSSAQSLSDEFLRSKKSKPADAGIAVDDVSTRELPVKDLRSRRIFSPAKIEGGRVSELGFQTEDIKSSDHVDLWNTKGDSNGPDPNGVIGKDSSSQNKLVVKSSLRRKVLKVPGSHNYSRLLPFLMNMAKDETWSFTVSPSSGIPKTEKIDMGPQKFKDEDKCAHSGGVYALENEEMNNCGNKLSHEAQNSNELNISNTGRGSNGVIESAEEQNVSNVDDTDPKISSLVDSSDLEDENEGAHGLKPLENGNIINLSTLSSCETLDMDQPNLSESEEGIHLGINDQKGNENDGTDTYTEGNIQTTRSNMNIFSNPEINMVESEKSPKEKFAVDDNSFDMDQLKLSGSEEGVKKAFNSEDLDLDQRNLFRSEEGFQLDDPGLIRNMNGFSGNGDDKFTEDYVQTTPPDMNILSNLKINMVENLKEKTVIENDSTACGSPFKKKVVLNPCSRRRVFKAPGSFSYRRLLPYLMEVSNDNPHTFSDASKYPQLSKIIIDPEEKKPLKHLDRSELSFSSKESISNVDSSEKKLTLVSSEKSIELQKSFDSPNKSMLPVEEQIIFDIIKDLDLASGGENSEIDMSSPAKALESECLNPKLSQVEESFYFDNPEGIKGILRRNPRGCRGLCNCLNCTSFRLNADRAFEFSRNQMLDAEEVALDLINELSRLRNMLKESTVHPNGQVIADSDQVMAAYTKALKVEELAKCRLKEMHSDLTAHCRSKLLERPTVRFSEHDKDTVIAGVD